MQKAIKDVLVGVVAFSVTLNVALLAYAYRHSSEETAQAAPRVQIKEGAEAPKLTGAFPDGRPFTAVYGSKPTLLYVISPSCGWCERNTANVTALWQQRKDDHEFIGLTVKADGLSDYLAKSPLPFPVVIPSAEAMSAYGLGPTPSLIMVRNGRIAFNLNGAWGRSKPGLEKAFNVTLPGITGTP